MRFKRFISILLAVAIVAACAVAASSAAASGAKEDLAQTGATDYGLMSTVQSSTILQAWDWSYKNVEDNLELIAEQGFTTVQVSPASVLNGTSAGSTFNEAWKVYQPGCLKMNGGSGMPDNNVLGTKAEFTSMCNTAHQLGIKIIVDTVVNHVGGDKFTESDTNPLNHLTADGYYIKNYQPELYNKSCFHDYYILNDWNDDWQLVKFAVLNLPDLNTSNSTVQTAAKNYMQELITAGADGFRFDAAKHIETPNDRSELKSDFWPNTLTAVQKANSKEIYAYGEVLGVGNNRQFSWYTALMDVTDSGTSDSIRGAITNKTTNGAVPWFPSGSGNPDQIVLWTESHDNFEGGSYGTPVGQIGKIWALEAGRAAVTCVYFGRPGNDSSYRSIKLGTANKTGWANATTKAVNQFHNYFNGKSEYCSTQGDIAYIERGTTGAILVNVTDSYGNISVDKHTLEDGAYKDAISGNSFSVAGGKISGSIGNTGVAVIYKDGTGGGAVATAEVEVRDGCNTVIFTNNKGWGAPNVYFWGGTGASTDWPGTAMAYIGKNDYDQPQYVGYVPKTCQKIIINDGTNQSADYTGLTGHTGLCLTDDLDGGNYKLGTFSISDMLPVSATESNDPTDPMSTTSTTAPSTTPTVPAGKIEAREGYNIVLFSNNKDWSGTISCYYWGGAGGSAAWPGSKMDYFDTNEFGQKRYYAYVPATCENIIINNGSNQSADFTTLTSSTGLYLTDTKVGNYYTLGTYDISTLIYDAAATPTEGSTTATSSTEAPTTVDPTTATSPTSAPETQASTSAPESYIIGDADGNGEVDILDATAIQRVLAEYPVSNFNLTAANITGGGLNIVDATTIQRYLAEYDVPYEIGKLM